MQTTSTIATHPPRTRGRAGSPASVWSVWRAWVALSLWLLAALLPQSALAGSTTTTLASSDNPVIVGVAHNLTATIVGVNPTGNVTFKSGSTVIGTVALSGGGNSPTAVLPYTWTTAGAKSLKAVYAGDSGNTTSTSSALAQTVSKLAATASLVSATNPLVVGDTSVLTATVVGYNPTGNVTFKNGTTTLGTVAVSGTGNTRTATYTATFTAVSAGASLTAVYAGNTNNNTVTSAAVTQVVTIKPTTSTLAVDKTSATANSDVTFTATVVGYNPSGNVAFKNGTTTLGTVALTGTGNTRTATYINRNLAVGSYSNITAVYAGSSTNATSTSAAAPTLTITAAGATNSTTTLTSATNPTVVGGSTLLTATVTGTDPTGQVSFKRGSTVVGTALLTGTGDSKTATYTYPLTTASTVSLTSAYVGDAVNKASTSTAVSQVTSKAPTTTSVTSSLNPAAAGATITFTATVTGYSPSGNVAFLDNGTITLITVATTGTGTTRSATYTTAALGNGPHSISVAYAGNTTDLTSTSAALNQSIGQVATTNTLTSSANPSLPNAAVSFTAMVSGNNPGGNVTFKDGATTLGTTALTGTGNTKTASYTTAALTSGAHSITAVYAGDTLNLTSTSSALAQTVNSALAATSTTLSASTLNPTLGASITLSANVTGTTPTGSVVFMDGAVTLGTVALTGNTASLQTSALAAGSHTLSARYGGDGTNAPSTSSLVALSVTDLPALVYQYGYDAMGRPTIAVDPNGQTTTLYYDTLGRPIQKQEPANQGTTALTITSTAYDLADNVTKVTDPRNLDTTYSPNGLGQVSAQTSPDTGIGGFTYDAIGNLKTKTDARGKVTTYDYDVRDRLTSISYPSGTPTTLEYDGGTTPYAGAKGELTKISDESGSQTYTYDSAGRLISKTQITLGSPANKTFTVAYTWGDTGSAIDKLTGITYPSGNRVNYSYDATGQLAGVSINGVNANGIGTGGTTTPLLSGITTRADGALQGWQWASAGAHSLGYDSFGQLVSYPLGKPDGSGTAAGQIRTISRDAAGRITGFSHTNNATATPTPTPSLEQSYTYDNLNRVLSSSSGGVVTQYSYDATGNRTSKVINATTYTNTVSPTSNRLTQVQDVGGTASLQYDAAGNITGDGNNTYVYSDRGRMNSATNAGGTVAYAYNALELRVSKTGPTNLVPTGASYFVYDESGNLLGEYDANSNPIYETVYLGSGLAALPVGVMKLSGSAGSSTLATGLYNVYADHTSTPRVITRTSDSVMVWRWDTAEAFGATAPDQNPSSLGTFSYNQRFPGQVFDAETGLFDNWNRTYDARQGRYRQSDPIGLAGGVNTYSYVTGNPLSYVDPMGLDRWGDAPAQSYYCTAPLHALPSLDLGGIGPFHHGFVCTSDGVCGGQDRSGNPLLSPGKPSEGDKFNPGRCEPEGGPSRCEANCLSKAIDSPRPLYSIIPNATARVFPTAAPMCQEWAQQKIMSCKLECKGK